MAATEVQTVIQSHVATTVTVTIATAVSGNLLISAFSQDKSAGTITIPTDFILINQDVTTDVSVSVAYKIAVGGETSITWTCTGGGGSGGAGWVGEYSGLTATPLDQKAEEANSGSAVTSKSTGITGETAQSNELALAYLAIDSASNFQTGRAWTNNFSEIDVYVPGSGAAGISIARKDLVATGTVETTFSTTDTGDQMTAGVVTFKELVAGAVRLIQLMKMGIG